MFGSLVSAPLRCLGLSWFVAVVPATSALAQPASDGDELRPEIARAAAEGLEFLAARQLPSGAWDGSSGYKMTEDYRIFEANVPHVGVTALCGMAFLAGGHTPGRGPYGELLERAVEYLLGRVNELGFITGHQTRMYSHAFATLFLAEVYGNYHHPDLEKKLTETVSLIVAAQNPSGSWRYQPFALESDMSITVCQIMALRAARNAGIEVPARAIDRATQYVMDSLVTEEEPWGFGYRGGRGYYDTGRGAFTYQLDTDRRSSFALTAAGITCLIHASRWQPHLQRDSLGFLEEKLQTMSANWQGHFFYYYGHYYAVQALYLSDGSGDGRQRWSKYWQRVSGELLDSQLDDGSWPNRIGPGSNFGTAVACFVLQVPNQYLPILQR